MKSIRIIEANEEYPHSKKVINLFILLLFLIASFLITTNSAMAQPLVCPERAIQQLTDDFQNSDDASIDDAGISVVFISSANFTGDNPNNIRQIFLVNAITGAITQLTDGSVNSDSPCISGDGTVTVFRSDSNLTGNNPQNIDQIFLVNNTTGVITQITNITDPNDGVASPSANASGTIIAFGSEADITGANPDGNMEIFLFNVTTGTFTQITDTIGGFSNRTPSVNADGTRIAFRSEANINGGNPLNISQIYLFDTTTGTFTQITFQSDGDSFQPSINADGTLIAFSSRGNINGGNPEGNQEIYLANVTTGTITQITNTTSGNSRDPSLSANGARIAFESTANIIGPNPDNDEEVYVFDISSGTFTRVTNESGPGNTESEDASINGDGTRIAFESQANINGGNPDAREQIFLAVCRDTGPLPIPTLSEWGLIVMAGLLGLVGFIAIRKKYATA